jgi:hypothetical protein
MLGKSIAGLMGKKLLGMKLALIGGTCALLLAASAPAQASNVRIGVAVNLGGLIGQPIVATIPAPVVYAPAPVCAPPTVIYETAPVYYQYPAYHPEFRFWAGHNDHRYWGGGWGQRFGGRR